MRDYYRQIFKKLVVNECLKTFLHPCLFPDDGSIDTEPGSTEPAGGKTCERWVFQIY
jgi:hypothetical protein